MKNFWFIAFVALAAPIFGQANIASTEAFKISGLVKKESSISISDLKKYSAEKISPVKLTNHKGELKAKLKGLRGIPLVAVLKNLEIEAENPKILSEFYLVFCASDGYKVVYSWNEIFNPEIGQESYFITEKTAFRWKICPNGF